MFNHTGEYQHYFGLTGTPDFLQALADFYTRSVEDDITSISVKGLKINLTDVQNLFSLISYFLFSATLKKLSLCHKLKYSNSFIFTTGERLVYLQHILVQTFYVSNLYFLI